MQQLRITIVAAAFLFALTLFGAPLTSAATYWAAPNGSDSNSCSSVSGTSDPKRYRTIGGIWSCLSGGDTAKLKEGTYNYYATNPPIPSGASTTNRTKVACETITSPPSCSFRPTNAPSGTTIILFNEVSRRHIEFDGIRLDASQLTSPRGFRTSGGAINDVWLTNCEATAQGATTAGSAMTLGSTFTDGGIVNCHIHHWNPGGGRDPGSHGIYARGQRNLIERNHIHDVEGLAIQVYNTTGGVDDYIVRYNTFHHTGKTAMYCGTGARNKCYGNLIYSSNNKGITVKGTQTEVYNNTIYNVASYGISIDTSGAQVRNNIVYKCGATCIRDSVGSSTLSNNFTSDPLFVDPSKGNFKLKPESPAIDKGTTLSVVSSDLYGTPRPQAKAYDIGAYEHPIISNLPQPPGSLRATSAQ